MVVKVVGALNVAVAAVAFLFLLAFDPLFVPRERLLSQLFRIGRFRSGQWTCRRSVPTRQAIEEGAQALHAESVPAVARAAAPGGWRWCAIGGKADSVTRSQSSSEVLVTPSSFSVRA